METLQSAPCFDDSKLASLQDLKSCQIFFFSSFEIKDRNFNVDEKNIRYRLEKRKNRCYYGHSDC